MKRLFLSFLIIGSICRGQDGTPDLSFGEDGVAIYPVSVGSQNEQSELRGADETSQGDIIVLLNYDDYENGALYNVLMSVDEYGLLNTNFGTSGFVFSPVEAGVFFTDLKILPDDSMLIVYKKSSAFGLVKLLSEGTIDTSYGDNGFVEVFPNSGYNNYWFYLNDGGFLFVTLKELAGETNLYLKKVLDDGAPDPDFGTAGEVQMSVANFSPYALKGVDVNSSGEVFLSLYENIPDGYQYHVIKFNQEGELDLSYGEDGFTLVPMDPEYNNCRVFVFENGSTLNSCSYYDPASDMLYKKIVKLNPFGNQDMSFGFQGALNGQYVYLIQPNQRFITDNPEIDWEGGYYPNLRRYFSSGNFDNSFTFSINNPGPLGLTKSILLDSGHLLMVSSEIWYNNESNVILQKFNNSPLGTEEFVKNKVVISPNPSEALFQIKLNTYSEIIGFKILDVSGKVIKSERLRGPNFTLDLSNFEDGMYFLNLVNKTYKLIKN